jgi:protein-L-isoaspartate(D-aspartate) O-methyltransferase
VAGAVTPGYRRWMDRARALAQQLSDTIGDPRVLEAVASVPRELFVPPRLRRRAYEDEALPIGGGQTISQPTVVARMLELLELTGAERVLDVGTGSGYHAALLARLAREVISIERDRALARDAARRLALAGAANVRCAIGDGWAGDLGQGVFDAINVAATPGPEPPPGLVAQLAPEGRLVIPLGDPGRRGQVLTRLRRHRGRITRERFEPVRFVPLIPGGGEPGGPAAEDPRGGRA